MHKLKTLLISAGLALLTAPVSAQSVTDLQDMTPEDRRAYLESMSDDERNAMREKWRNEVENMSEEERQAMREKRRAKGEKNREHARERWQSMSEEERAVAREKRKEKGKGMRKKRKGKKRQHAEGANKAEQPATSADD